MNECVFIYRTYHILFQGGLQFYCEIERRLASASPSLPSPALTAHRVSPAVTVTSFLVISVEKHIRENGLSD